MIHYVQETINEMSSMSAPSHMNHSPIYIIAEMGTMINSSNITSSPPNINSRLPSNPTPFIHNDPQHYNQSVFSFIKYTNSLLSTTHSQPLITWHDFTTTYNQHFNDLSFKARQYHTPNIKSSNTRLSL